MGLGVDSGEEGGGGLGEPVMMDATPLVSVPSALRTGMAGVMHVRNYIDTPPCMLRTV